MEKSLNENVVNEVVDSMIKESDIMKTSGSCYGLFSVYDKAMREFSPPFTAKNSQVAGRMFQRDKVKVPAIVNDLVLYKLGYWFPEKGYVVSDLKPREVTELEMAVNNNNDLTDLDKED